MPEADERARCPHCGSELDSMRMPDDGGWNGAIQLVCFNDECSYFKEGWDWMWEKYQVKTSYRYRQDPRSGAASPLPVWSKDALKDRIIED